MRFLTIWCENAIVATVFDEYSLGAMNSYGVVNVIDAFKEELEELLCRGREWPEESPVYIAVGGNLNPMAEDFLEKLAKFYAGKYQFRCSILDVD